MSKFLKIFEVVKWVVDNILPYLKARRERKLNEHLITTVEEFADVEKDAGKVLKTMIKASAKKKINKLIDKKVSKLFKKLSK